MFQNSQKKKKTLVFQFFSRLPEHVEASNKNQINFYADKNNTKKTAFKYS